jgi:hypothetical protein
VNQQDETIGPTKGRNNMATWFLFSFFFFFFAISLTIFRVWHVDLKPRKRKTYALPPGEALIRHGEPKRSSRCPMMGWFSTTALVRCSPNGGATRRTVGTRSIGGGAVAMMTASKTERHEWSDKGYCRSGRLWWPDLAGDSGWNGSVRLSGSVWH